MGRERAPSCKLNTPQNSQERVGEAERKRESGEKVREKKREIVRKGWRERGRRRWRRSRRHPHGH